LIITGPTVASFDSYTSTGPVTGPTSFGSGGDTHANSGSGSEVGIVSSEPDVLDLILPEGYTSDSSLSDTSAYDNQTFTSLGVTPGTYVWTWGSGADQKFTLDVVPAPVIGHGLLVVLAVGGVLLGSKLLERRREVRLQSG
jgi:hypothetical protein